MPHLTVVIPTHNRSALLAQTLRSALNQRAVDLQVVVVDDGSSDDTPDVVARLQDRRVTLIRNERPQGVSAARNCGIAAASGEWIAFLDDDDLWAPDKLMSQLVAARRDARSWACSGSVTVTQSLEILAGAPPPTAESIVEQLPLRNVVPAGASNVVVRKDVLAEVGLFDLQLRHMSDWDLWIRLGQFGLPAVVREPLVAVRLHTSNASADTDAILCELDVVEARYAGLRDGAPVDRPYVYRWAAWTYVRVGRRDRALRAYLRAAMAGDPASLGRAALALLDPALARRPLRRHLPDPSWEAKAAAWLREVYGP
jgi:glycosyltransferase involved in cell wall biosynthesis